MGATESESGPVPFTVVLCPILTLQFSDPTPPRRASKSSFRAGDVPWINSVPPSVPSNKIQNFFRNLFGKLWTRYSYRILLGSIKELKIGISWLRFSHELHLESTVDSDRKRCCDHKEIHGSRESLVDASAAAASAVMWFEMLERSGSSQSCFDSFSMNLPPIQALLPESGTFSTSLKTKHNRTTHHKPRNS